MHTKKFCNKAQYTYKQEHRNIATEKSTAISITVMQHIMVLCHKTAEKHSHNTDEQ